MQAFQTIRDQFPLSQIEYLPRVVPKRPSNYSRDKTVNSVNFRSFLQATVSTTMLLFHAYQNDKFLLIDNDLVKQNQTFRVVCKPSVNEVKDSRYLKLGRKVFGEDVYTLIQYFFDRLNHQETRNLGFDLFEGFQELMDFLQKSLEDDKLSQKNTNKMMQEIIQNCWIFRQLLLSQRLKDKLLIEIWLTSSRQKHARKLSQFQKRIIQCQKNIQAINILIRSFFMTAQFPIQISYTKTISGLQENFEMETHLNQQRRQYNTNYSSSQDSGDSCRFSFTEFKFCNQKQESCSEISKLKKLSQQISMTHSQLIDYTDCQYISKKFYDKFFKNYLNLISLGVECKNSQKENHLSIELKIKCQVSLTKLDFLELQKIFNQILAVEAVLKEKDNMVIIFDDQTSKFFILSTFTHQPSKQSLILAILSNIDQLLILYACIDAIIIFHCQKSVKFFQKNFQDKQIQIMANPQQLESIAERFIFFLTNYRKKMKAFQINAKTDLLQKY